MKRLALMVVLLVLAACGPVPRPPVTPPAPPTPADHALTVQVFVGDPSADAKLAGVEVSLRTAANPTGPAAATDAAGNVTFRLPAGDYDVWTEPAGYSRAEQHVELRADTSVALSVAALPPPAPPRPPTIRGRLEARGRAFVYPDGTRFRWRGVTAFALLDQVADGREDQARAFLVWARDTGFTVVRVLAMARWLFDLSPEAGRAALPRLFELVRDADLYVELVALADTRAFPGLDLRGQVRAVGAQCAAVEHCLLEVANEPYHGTHVEGLTPARLADLAREVPGPVLVALGSAADDESREMAIAPADYVTVHLDRGRDAWNMVRRVRELELLSADTGLPVVDDEPDGFGEAEWVTRVDGTPYRRQVRPELAFGMGVLGRVFEVGSTFHCEAGLTATVPGPVQQAAAAAFVAGARIVPDDQVLSFRNAGWPGSPVSRFRAADGPPIDHAAVRAYSGLAGDAAGITVLLGVRGDPAIEWGGGWRPGAVLAERPEIKVIEIRR